MNFIFEQRLYLPARNLVDGEVNLPDATTKSFWLHGSTWQFPDFVLWQSRKK